MIDMRIKQLFFDRERVASAVDKARRKVLARAGAFVRTAARRSMRKRKESAPPGSPPHAHEGGLRRLILFGYDPASESVVVGPARLNKPGEAPRVLEHGGTTVIRRRRRGRTVRKRVRIKPRPFMGPALEKQRARLPKLWRDSVKGR